MPPRKDVDAAASVPAFYGAELRWKREHAGLTLQELATGCFYSVAYLSQIEMGDRRMPLDLARLADQKLCTDGFFERRCEDARKPAGAVTPSTSLMLWSKRSGRAPSRSGHPC